MTREQAQSLIQSEPKAWEVIDEIYNDFEEQLANLKHNYEMQEIMITDYKKHIAELEAPKSCLSCKYFSNVFKECNALDIKWSGVIENFYCSEYEPKDK